MGMGEAVVISGARVFHIKTPMLKFPSPTPEFKVTRHRVSMPADELGLDLPERYQEFLMAAQEEGSRQVEAESGFKTDSAGPKT